MNIREIISAIKDVLKMLEWEQETLNDFHAYAQKYGGTPGGNVYKFVLNDALRLRLKLGE